MKAPIQRQQSLDSDKLRSDLAKERRHVHDRKSPSNVLGNETSNGTTSNSTTVTDNGSLSGEVGRKELIVLDVSRVQILRAVRQEVEPYPSQLPLSMKNMTKLTDQHTSH